MRPTISRWTRAAAMALVAVSWWGCGGGDKSTTPPPPPTVGLTVAPASLTVTAGQGGTATVNVTGTNLTGAVSLAVTGAPSGVTATLSPTSVTGSSGTSTLTVATTAAAAAGTSTLTITGTTPGSGGTSVTQTAALSLVVNAAPAIAVSLSPATVSVQQGQSGTSTLTITRTNFTGSVTVTATGAPAGLTVTPSGGGTGNSATLAVAAASSVAPGTYPVTITVAGTGVATQTATLSVTVTSPPASIALSLSPAAVSVQQGATTTTTLTIARTNFTGAVNVGVGSTPSGLTVTPASTSTTGSSVSIAVGASASTAPGTYQVPITGSGTGLANQSATLAVTVTQASTGGGSIIFPICPEDSTIWVGYQSEGGTWTRATMTATSATVNVGARGAVGIVTRSGTRFTTQIVYASSAELSQLSGNGCALTATGSKTVKGSVAGVGQLDVALLALGSASTQIQSTSSGFPNFSLNNVEEGPQDLLATRGSFDLTTGGITPNKLIVRRDLNIPNNGSLAVLDFNASEAVAPASANVTIQNLGSDQPSVFTSYITKPTSVSLAPFAFSGGSGTSTQKFYGVPASLQRASDLHLLFVLASPPNSNGDSGRGVITLFKTVADKTVTLGTAVATPTVSLVGNTPYARFRVQQPVQSDYSSGLIVNFNQAATATTSSREVDLDVLPGYTATAPTTWDATIPDMTAAGYDPTWGLRPATPTNWDLSVFGGNFLNVFGGSATEGATLTLGTRSGQTTSLSALRAAPSGGSLSSSATRRVLLMTRELRRRAPR